MADRCLARTRRGTPCQKEAGWGTQHVGVGRCKLHGGAEPHAQVNGMVQLARRDMAVMGCPLAIEPHEAILECIRISAGEVRYASDRVAELQAGDAVGPVLTSKLDVPGPQQPDADESEAEESLDKANSELAAELRFGPPATHIWIEVRHRAMDRLVAYSAAALKAGIEERLVRVAESTAQLLAQAVRGILTDLGVQDDPEAPAIVRKHLTLLSRAVA